MRLITIIVTIIIVTIINITIIVITIIVIITSTIVLRKELQTGTYCVREGFKNPRHGNFPLGGYPPPPPRGLHGREFSEKLAEKS